MCKKHKNTIQLQQVNRKAKERLPLLLHLCRALERVVHTILISYLGKDSCNLEHLPGSSLSSPVRILYVSVRSL